MPARMSQPHPPRTVHITPLSAGLERSLLTYSLRASSKRPPRSTCAKDCITVLEIHIMILPKLLRYLVSFDHGIKGTILLSRRG